MNIIALTGRLTKDPELKSGQSGKVYARFTLAVDRVDYKIDNKTLILKLAISKTKFYRNFKSIADECRKLNRSESLFG